MQSDETTMTSDRVISAERAIELAEGAAFWQRYRLWGKLVAEGRKHSYEGTVPAKTIASRRTKNKRAKASRKANR